MPSRNKKRKRRFFPKFYFSLRYKLALSVLLIVMFFLFLVFQTTLSVIKNVIIENNENRLQTVANVFTETLKVPMRLGNQKALQAHIAWMAEQPSVAEVRVEDMKGITVGSMNEISQKLPEVFQKSDFYGIKSIGIDNYVVAVPIKLYQNNIGRLIIVFSQINLQMKVGEILKDHFEIAFWMTFLLAMVIAGITWFFVQPIFVLEKTAHSILKGDLEARASVHSNDEIEMLSGAFNEMVTRLIGSFENLGLRTQALEESEEKYRLIINNVSDIIFSITPDGDLELLNRGFSGYSREEIMTGGLSLILSMHVSNDKEKFQEALETICKEKMPITHLGTKHLNRIHETEIYYRTNLTPVIDYTGDLKLIQGVMRDVTELRKVETMRETLIRDVAHELKTPVAKFEMTLGWLEKQVRNGESEEGKEKYMPIIRMLRSNTDRLMKTIISIMDLSKIETGMIKVKKREIDINDVLKQVISDMKNMCEQKDINLEVCLSHAELKVKGDPDMLYRVFVNLMANAIKFMHEGKITVTSNIIGGNVSIDIADQGVGMDQETIERIFDPFFQKTASAYGIGIGLTLSREIVFLHKGDIWAESNGLNQGSVFKVILPAFLKL